MRGTRHLAAAVLSASLLLGTSATAFTPRVAAQEVQAGQPVVVSVAALNVRSAPSLSGSIVAILTGGEVISVVSRPTTADGYDWYQIERGGVYLGWAVRGFIPDTAGSTPAPSTPPTTPTTPPTTPPAGGFTYGTSVTVTASLLNVRALPTISGQILTVYPAGRVATITGEAQVADNITWYPVDNLGWVSGEYLRATSGGTTTPPTPTTPPSTGATSIWRVDVDALNIRATPGTSGAIVRTVPFGTRLTQTGSPVAVDGRNWFPMDNVGWVSAQFVVLVQEELYVTTDVLNVRSTPSTAGTILRTLTYAQTVNVFDFAYDANGELWQAIDTAGTQWVSGRYISIRLPGQ